MVEHETSPESERPSRRRILMLFGIVVLLVVALALLISRCGSSGSPNSGSHGDGGSSAAVEMVTIQKVGIRIVITKSLAITTYNGDDCGGAGAQRAAQAGATVTIRSVDGAELGTGTYGMGVYARAAGTCTITTAAPIVVPKADAYLVEGPGFPAGGARVTAADLAAAGWSYVLEVASR